MTKAIIPKPIKLDGLADALLAEQERIASVYIRNKFQEIQAPFESSIGFDIKTESEGRNQVTTIFPTNAVAGTNAAGDQITGAELWNWLDNGTRVRKYGMPSDFTNETSPNSLSTGHSSYNRDGIFPLREPENGIEARNFTKQVLELYKNTYRLNMERVLQSYINGTRK